MAKKKAEEIPTHDFKLDVGKLVLTKEHYINEMGQYLMEQLPSCSIDRDGNTLNIKLPDTVEKRKVRFRISKFLYQSGLKSNYKIIDWIASKVEGYQIIDR